MTEFWAGALLLLALAAVFLLFPGWFLRQRRIRDQAEANRAWYERRREELAAERGDADTLLADAGLRLLQDEVGEVSVASVSDQRRWSRNLALGLLLATGAAAILLYRELGAAPDVLLADAMAALETSGSEEDYRTLMGNIETRAAQRPDNLFYQSALGRYYLDEGDYGRARRQYLELAEKAPGDASVLAMAAQAAYLAAGRELDNETQLLAEEALAINPHQRTALGLLGMAAWESDQPKVAVTYWKRLLVVEDPNSPTADMIRGIIARVEGGDQQVAESGAPAPGGASSTEATGATTGAAVTVRVSLPAGADIQPGDTVFVFARDPATGSRMPVAVKRLTASELPATLRLDDASSMAGQKISSLAAVDVVARVSPSGQPGEAAATYQGALDALAPETGGGIHSLVLQPRG